MASGLQDSAVLLRVGDTEHPMQRQRDRCVLGAFSALEPVSPKGGPTHATLLDEEAFATAK